MTEGSPPGRLWVSKPAQPDVLPDADASGRGDGVARGVHGGGGGSSSGNGVCAAGAEVPRGDACADPGIGLAGPARGKRNPVESDGGAGRGGGLPPGARPALYPGLGGLSAAG